MIEVLGNHGLCDIVDVFEVLVIIERALDDVELLKKLLHVKHSFLGEADVTGFLIKHVISVRLKLGSLLESGKCRGHRVLSCLRVLLTFLEV